MVVIAVVGITISTAVGGVAAQTFSLERRTVAHWVGQNHAHRMRMTQRRDTGALAEGRDTTRILMADRDWEVVTEIEATDSPLIPPRRDLGLRTHR